MLNLAKALHVDIGAARVGRHDEDWIEMYSMIDA